MQRKDYDALCDAGRDLERAEQLERAEDLIAGEQQINADRDHRIAEQIAVGDVCRECGAELVTPAGCSAVCVDCGGSAASVPWRIGGRYFSDPASAHSARINFIARRRAMVARIRRVEADAWADTQRAIDLAAFVGATFAITDAGRSALRAADTVAAVIPVRAWTDADGCTVADIGPVPGIGFYAAERGAAVSLAFRAPDDIRALADAVTRAADAAATELSRLAGQNGPEAA